MRLASWAFEQPARSKAFRHCFSVRRCAVRGRGAACGGRAAGPGVAAELRGRSGRRHRRRRRGPDERPAARTGAADDGAGGGADAAHARGRVARSLFDRPGPQPLEARPEGEGQRRPAHAGDAGAQIPHRGRLRSGRRAPGQPRRQSRPAGARPGIPRRRLRGRDRGDGRRAGDARRGGLRRGAVGSSPGRGPAVGAPDGGEAGPAGHRFWRCCSSRSSSTCSSATRSS